VATLYHVWHVVVLYQSKQQQELTTLVRQQEFASYETTAGVKGAA
jgi:hypothetical protein